MEHVNVLVATSHVIRGRVGGRGAVFALERLGHPVWSLPTITMPWHPGHGVSTRAAINDATFSAQIEDLITSPHLSEISGILTGYMGSKDQAAALAKLIKAIKKANPEAVYCCDPIMGDEGGLYVSEEVAVSIRDHLIPLADIITPNRFEFSWLTGTSPTTNEDIIKAASTMDAGYIAITSAIPMMHSSHATLLVEQAEAYLAEHRTIPTQVRGAGDLFAATFLARYLQLKHGQAALKSATAAVFEILAHTNKMGADELVLIEEQSRLERPMAMVNIRKLHKRATLSPEIKDKRRVFTPTAM